MKALLKMETTISQILSNLIEHYSPRLEKRPPNHPGCPLHLPLLPHPLLLPHSPLLPPVPQPASLPTLVQPVKHAGHGGAEVHDRRRSCPCFAPFSIFASWLASGHPSPTILLSPSEPWNIIWGKWETSNCYNVVDEWPASPLSCNANSISEFITNHNFQSITVILCWYHIIICILGLSDRNLSKGNIGEDRRVKKCYLHLRL